MPLPSDLVVAALIRTWEAYAVRCGATPFEAASIVGGVRAQFAGVDLTPGIVDQVLVRIRAAAEQYAGNRAAAAGAAASRADA